MITGILDDKNDYLAFLKRGKRAIMIRTKLESTFEMLTPDEFFQLLGAVRTSLRHDAQVVWNSAFGSPVDQRRRNFSARPVDTK